MPDFDLLTLKDKENIRMINKRANYCITHGALLDINKRHRLARQQNNIKKMQWYEYRLTDMNLYYECGLLQNSNYNALKNTYVNQ